jgi:hypothetical protein
LELNCPEKRHSAAFTVLPNIRADAGARVLLRLIENFRPRERARGAAPRNHRFRNLGLAVFP